MSTAWAKDQSGPKWGLAFFYKMIRLGGRPLAYFCLYFVVFAYAFFFPSVKKKCTPYLSRRFPHAGRIKQAVHRYRLILMFGKILIDRAILGIVGPSTIQAQFEDPKDFHTIKSMESGFIILMSHVGCWQVAMSALSQLDRPVNLLMLQKNDGTDKHYYEHKKGGKEFKVINPDQFLGGTLDMLEVLTKNEILCIMGDRIFGNTALSLEMDFLKDKTQIPFSAYRLSSISQKPIVILNSYKSGQKSYKLSIPGIIQPPPKLGKNRQNYIPFAQTFVDTLESYLDAHPYQFFNFYDMWTPMEIQDEKTTDSRKTVVS